MCDIGDSMSINILLGKNKYEKSKYIFDNIDKKIEDNHKVILFVPSQYRMIEEENYMSFQKKMGLIGVNITTISEYVSGAIRLKNMSIKDTYINKLERKIILNKIISDDSYILKTFSKVKNKTGFLDMLNIYIDLLRKENIQIEDIKKLSLDDKNLENKIKEIGNIYDKYIESINNRYIDDIDEIIFSLEVLPDILKSNDIKDIYFDGYNNFSYTELCFIETLLKSNVEVTISINIPNDYDDNFNEDGIFEVSRTTFIDIIKLCKKNNVSINIENFLNDKFNDKEDINFLINNIFENVPNEKRKAENIDISIKSNIYEEVRDIAKKIRKSVVCDGYKYSDFAIYTSNISEYDYVIKQVFYEYLIPVYLDTYKDISKNSLFKYIAKFLDVLCYGLNNDNLFEILKLELSDLNIEDVNYFENYVLEFNIKKYGYLHEFTLNNRKSDEVIYDLKRINYVRNKIVEMFLNEKYKITSNSTAKQIVEIIYNHITQYKIIDKFNDLTNKLSNDEDAYLKYCASINIQVLERIYEIFDSVVKIYGEENISYEEFKNIFVSCKDSIKLKSIPFVLDQVLLLDVNVSKCSRKKHVFFVGLNENKFPLNISEDPIFSDRDLYNLEKRGLSFKQDSLSRLNMQLYNIYDGICNANENITFSFLATDTNSKPLRPSNVITIIKQILDIKIIGDITKSKSENSDMQSVYNSYTKEDLFYIFSKQIDKIYEKTKNNSEVSYRDLDEELTILFTIYNSIVKNDNELLAIINYIKNDDNLNKESIKKIYNDKLVTSVSKLELFKKCPFSYYMKYGLKLTPRKIYSITNMDIGSFMHSVLEKFSKYIFENDIKWYEMVNLDEKNKNVLDDIINDELEKSFEKHKENVRFYVLKRRLKDTMYKVISTIARSFNQSEFYPYGYEIEFKDGKLFAPIEIALDNDITMKIIGKIDRVDTALINEKMYVRVVDYKSSGRVLDLNDIKEGISLQLATYLYAFIEAYDNSKNNEYALNNIAKKDNDKLNLNIIPAGMLYFNLSDRLINIKNYSNNEDEIKKQITKELRMNGIFLKDIEIIKKMDKYVDTDNRLIDISTRTINSSNSSKKALTEAEYMDLCSEVKDILKNIGNEILKGVVSIKPLKKKDVCKYCNFSSICRKNLPL